jgi:hypothetical protein
VKSSAGLWLVCSEPKGRGRESSPFGHAGKRTASFGAHAERRKLFGRASFQDLPSDLPRLAPPIFAATLQIRAEGSSTIPNSFVYDAPVTK